MITSDLDMSNPMVAEDHWEYKARLKKQEEEATAAEQRLMDGSAKIAPAIEAQPKGGLARESGKAEGEEEVNIVGMRVYAKFTSYRDEPNGGKWFGAKVLAVDGMNISLVYDDGDEAGPGKTNPAARMDEVRFCGTQFDEVPKGFKEDALPEDACETPPEESCIAFYCCVIMAAPIVIACSPFILAFYVTYGDL